MLDKKTFAENKNEIIQEGCRYRLDLAGKSTQEFADTLLILTNHKCSNPNSGIVDIRTVYGTNLIIVDSTKTDDIDEYKKFTDDVIAEKIEIVNIFMDWLEEDGFIKNSFDAVARTIGY